MTKNEIRSIYTQKVTELLAQGYQISPETMSGSQGEIAHIDLTNGSEILRVLIESLCSYSEAYGDILTIRVGRCTDEIRASWHTIWNNRLETRSEIKLAKISENFYTTLEEGKRMAKVRYSRWCNRKCNDRKELGNAYKSIALRWLRRQPRMKSCKLEDIDRMIRRTRSDDTVCFEIEAKGKTFYLHA